MNVLGKCKRGWAWLKGLKDIHYKEYFQNLQIFKLVKDKNHTFTYRLVHGEPALYGQLYIVFIIIFAFIFFISSFLTDGANKTLGFLNSIYLSSVTITTLGFGDITPMDSAYWLKLTLSIESVIGIFTIGGFFTSLSNKISTKQAKVLNNEREVQEKEKNREYEERSSYAYTQLTGIVTNHLDLLSYLHRASLQPKDATGISELKNANNFFDDAYYQRISAINVYNDEFNDHSSEKIIDHLYTESSKIKHQIDKTLLLHSNYINHNTIEVFEKLKYSGLYSRIERLYQLSENGTSIDYMPLFGTTGGRTVYMANEHKRTVYNLISDFETRMPLGILVTINEMDEHYPEIGCGLYPNDKV